MRAYWHYFPEMLTLEMLTEIDIKGYRLCYTDIQSDNSCRHNDSKKWNKSSFVFLSTEADTRTCSIQ